MAFVKKTWKDRIVQYANRRLLTKSGGEVEQVTVTRDEGTISEAGDQFNASNMNNLEQRIDDGFDSLAGDNIPIESGSATNTKDYIDSKFIYSTTEKVVGKWIDNSPIYEKTIDLGYLPDNTSASTPHNISNLKFIIDFQGFGCITNSVYFPLPFVSSSPIYVAVSTTDVTITTTSNRSTTQGYITLRYVKN